jgi:hypothetical protein
VTRIVLGRFVPETLPRFIFGMHYTKLLFNRFGSVMMTGWTHPTAIERFLHRRKSFVGGFWRMLERVFTRIIKREARGHGAAGDAVVGDGQRHPHLRRRVKAVRACGVEMLKR